MNAMKEIPISEMWGQKKKGNWIQTATGVRFHLLDPRPGDFRIEDIAHALASQARFAGHTKWGAWPWSSTIYTVAEHSVRVARWVASRFPYWKRWEAEGIRSADDIRALVYAALLHDASDAYMLDMPRPFKYLPEFSIYKEIERDLMAKMAHDLFFEFPKPSIVDKADSVLLATEARDLFPSVIDNWHLKYGEMLPHKIVPWSPRKAKREFLKMFYELNPLGIKAPTRFGYISGARMNGFLDFLRELVMTCERRPSYRTG